MRKINHISYHGDYKICECEINIIPEQNNVSLKKYSPKDPTFILPYMVLNLILLSYEK